MRVISCYFVLRLNANYSPLRDFRASNTMYPTRLTTERLILRKIVLSETDFVFDYASDPDVTTYVAWPSPTTREDTREYLAEMLNQWDRNECFEYFIVRSSDSMLLGAISLVPEDHSVTIGYVIAKRFWGNGYATEAARHLVRLALAQKEIFRVPQ
ncbi:N-acetyltransferase [bacterium]|nr:N-acetyltransferase [bacterium]